MSVLIRKFRENVARTPNKRAFVIDQRSISYAELDSLISKVSTGLLNSGMKTGDHVGIVLPNSLEFLSCMLSAAELGLVIVPMNPSLSSDSIARAFQAADVQHVIASDLILDSLKSQWPLTSSDQKRVSISVGEKVSDALSYEDLKATKVSSAIRTTFPDDQAFILTMTSGSTGDPKPIILSQKTKLARASAAQVLYGVTENDVTLAATPLFHSLAERLVLLPLLTGGTSVLMPRFSAEEWLAVVAREEVTFSIAVSSQLKQILAVMRTTSTAVPSLRCLVSSSALLEDALKSELLGFLKCEFHECYGTSEVAIVTNLDPVAAARKVDSVGTPIPGTHVQIIDDNDALCAVGTPGEIICKTPMLFSGYYKKPEATAKAMRGEHFRTGDVGVLDTEGFLKFLGRKKEIIITGGINVYPKDIEDVLLSHADVLECAAVSVPDERLGEAVGVVIAMHPDKEANLRELRKLCAKKLADYQQPQHFKFVTALPRNAMGKVMKKNLNDIFTSNEGKSTL